MMTDIPSILLSGKGEKQIIMPAKIVNRHGMKAGATGAGKTNSLQVLAEDFLNLVWHYCWPILSVI
jgi:hypothetical protein